jgi:metal-responsive CopG/Arc/MetJ family transcriptional regulator
MIKIGESTKISFRSPAELIEKFDALARELGYNRSALFRRAVRKFFADLQQNEDLIYEVRKLPYVSYYNKVRMKQYTVNLRDDDYYLLRSFQEYCVRFDFPVSMMVRASMAYFLKLYNAL